MRQAGIVGLHLRRKRRTTLSDPAAVVAADLLERDFAVDRPNRKWAGDLTYLRVADRWWYLATVIDLHSRHLIGCSLADHARAELVGGALTAAVDLRGGKQAVKCVIFHSDHGTQYTAGAFQAICAAHGVIQSMGTIGDSLDNAVAKSFFATLKRELGERFATAEYARLGGADLGRVLQPTSPPLPLGYRSPVDYERLTAHSPPQAA